MPFPFVRSLAATVLIAALNVDLACASSVDAINSLLTGKDKSKVNRTDGSGDIKSPASAAARPDYAKLRIRFVRGAGVQSIMPLKRFQDPLRAAMGSQNLHFHLRGADGYNDKDLLKIISKSDIFYINTHSGQSSNSKKQIIKVKAREGSKRYYLTGVAGFRSKNYYIDAEAIGQATGHHFGPRLVIINGCTTTNYTTKWSKPVNLRLATGFGIANGDRGRAYLGWNAPVIGAAADEYFGKVMAAWTTPGKAGRHPTINEAIDATGPYGNKRPTIVGDSTLRYDFVAGFVANSRIVGKWRIEKFTRPGDDGKTVTDTSLTGSEVTLKADGSVDLTAKYTSKKGKTTTYKLADLQVAAIRWMLTGDYDDTGLEFLTILKGKPPFPTKLKLVNRPGNERGAVLRVHLASEKETYFLSRVD